MKKLLAALALAAVAAPARAEDCQPMTTDAERLQYWCSEHPGANCEAEGRQMLPYISDYANCPDVDSAGRPMRHDRCADFSPLPPDCVGAAGVTDTGNGATATNPGGASSGRSGSAAKPGKLPIPLTCAPIAYGRLLIYRAQRCIFRPPHAVDGGGADVLWMTKDSVGSGYAVAFKPIKSNGFVDSIFTPGPGGSPYCRTKGDILDADGNPVPGCAKRGNGELSIQIRFTASDAPSGKGCSLRLGAWYFATTTLSEFNPNSMAKDGLGQFCNTAILAGSGIAHDF